MTGGAVELGYVDLIVASLLVLVAAGVSAGLQLGLERRLAIASARTVVQLLLVGYILYWAFEISNPIIVLLMMALMVVAASRAAVLRSSRTISGAYWASFITLALCGMVTTLAVTTVIIQVQPWYKAQYVIPLLGMILGNGLTGISLCLDTTLEQFYEKRALVEMELAHGASPWEAARDVLRDAVRRGMIPIINSMMVVGIVSLPGMMTGQILAGADPLLAVKYQIMVMFMIAAATSLGCMLMALLLYRRLFNEKCQLRAELIIKR